MQHALKPGWKTWGIHLQCGAISGQAYRRLNLCVGIAASEKNSRFHAALRTIKTGRRRESVKTELSLLDRLPKTFS
jgi:hypothetical protein